MKIAIFSFKNIILTVSFVFLFLFFFLKFFNFSQAENPESFYHQRAKFLFTIGELEDGLVKDYFQWKQKK